MTHSPSRRLLVSTALVAFAAGLPAAGWAQSPPEPPGSTYEPVSGQPGKDVVWVPTPDAVVKRMLQLGEVKPDDIVFDLGSGDGKIAIAAARDHGARATGLEYNPRMVEVSNRRAREAGVTDKVSFREADIFESDFSSATVVTMYLLPQLNLKLRPRLFEMKPGTRIVSHSFSMGDWVPDETSRAGTGDVYLWVIPANASGTWQVSGKTEGLPQTLRLNQKYQRVTGDAGFSNLTASVVQPQLTGNRFTFGVRDAGGTMLRFSGTVQGDRITGTVARGPAAPVPFEAVRSEPASPLLALASESEDNAAARALGDTQ